MTDDRRELQRIAYGRGTDESARDAAAQRLRELDREARRDAALEFDVPDVEPAPARRRWIVPTAVAAVVLAAAVAVWVVFLPTPLSPQAGATPGPVTPADAGENRPSPVANPFSTPGPLPENADLVQPDVDVQIPEWAVGSGGGGRDKILAMVALGEGQGFVVWGSLIASGEACLNLTTTTEGFGVCRPYAEFQEQGITADRGGWSVRWTPDGALTWEGLS